MHSYVSRAMAFALASAICFLPAARAGDDRNSDPAAKIPTQTPIKHVVVIVDENISFDHYFATYPNALNLPGESSTFYPTPDTPLVNGLTPTMITNNPNYLAGGSNPFRLAPSQAATCNPSNAYTKEQQAFDGGLLDKFTATTTTTSCGFFLPTPPQVLTMGYYDGNTVTALWNYAQNYALSDNFFDSLFGTTVMGHTTIISGQTNGLYVKAGAPVSTKTISEDSIIANVQPYFDDCAIGATPNVVMTGKNI